MTFQKVGPPGGWPQGGTVRSSEMNALDLAISQALDGSIAGDQLEGIVTTAPGASFKSTTPGGIQSAVPGGIALSGGPDNWITFGPGGSMPRSVSRWWPIQVLQPNAFAPGWSAYTAVGPPPNVPGLPFGQLIGPGGATKGSTQTILLPPLHEGATLSSAVLAFTAGAFPPYNLAGQPGTQFAVDILRLGMASITSWESLSSTLSSTTPSAQSPKSISLDGGLVQFFTFEATQNNVIDQTQYQYVAQIRDAFGANVTAQSFMYWSLQLNFANITSLAFP